MDPIIPDWPAPDNIRAVSTTRIGGFSEGPYQSLNLGSHVGDNPTHVAANRALLKSELTIPSDPSWLNQIHSASSIHIDQSATTTNADASFTTRRCIVCAVLTADCLPILLADSHGTCVAAIHAGWRGLLGGVIQNTVRQMDCQKLISWLGPAIGQDVFEVGNEVRTGFIAKNNAFANAFNQVPSNKSKWLANNFTLAKMILRSQGVDEIYGGGICTYSDANRFFSYRRDGVTGRMATLVWRQ